jgi:hypothetical protein
MRKTFEISLDMPDVTIQTVVTDRHGHFVITVKSTGEGTSCHSCGTQITKVYGEDREMTFRHVPMLGKTTLIRLRPV